MADAEDEDRELVRQTLNGRRQAFGELVERYQRPLFNGALLMVGDYDAAEEITQLAFVRAYERLDSFDIRFRFFSWIYRILVNGALDHIKDRRRRETLDEDVPTESSSGEDAIDVGNTRKELQAALMKLPAEYRAVIVLRHFEDLSYEEIGHVLNIPSRLVKSRLYSGRMMMREIMIKRGFVRYA